MIYDECLLIDTEGIMTSVELIARFIAQDQANGNGHPPHFGVRLLDKRKRVPEISLEKQIPTQDTVSFKDHWLCIKSCVDSVLENAPPNYESAYQSVLVLEKSPVYRQWMRAELDQSLTAYTQSVVVALSKDTSIDKMVKTAESVSVVEKKLALFLDDNDVPFHSFFTSKLASAFGVRPVAAQNASLIVAKAINDLRPLKQMADADIRMISLFIKDIGGVDVLAKCTSDETFLYYRDAIDWKMDPSFTVSLAETTLSYETELLKCFPIEVASKAMSSLKKALFLNLTEHMDEFCKKLVIDSSPLIVFGKLLLQYESDEATSQFVQSFKKLIQEMTAESLVKSEKEVIPSLIALQSMIRVAQANIHSAYISDSQLSFASLINQHTMKVAILAAEETHDIIINKSDKDLGRAVQLVKIFSDVEGTSAYLEHHKRLMARRLLSGYVSPREEELMALISESCGEEAAESFEVMLSDVKNSAVTMNRPLFGVTVLTMTAWPEISGPPIAVPAFVASAKAEFTKEYLSQNPRRSIKWATSVETVEFTYNGNRFVALAEQFSDYVKKGFLDGGGDDVITDLRPKYVDRPAIKNSTGDRIWGTQRLQAAITRFVKEKSKLPKEAIYDEINAEVKEIDEVLAELLRKELLAQNSEGLICFDLD